MPCHEGLETPQYALIDFPPSTKINGEDNVQSSVSYIIGPMATDNYYDNNIYSEDENYILQYTPPQVIMTGIKNKSKALWDISGNGLWYISVSKPLAKFEYDYDLIGIITELHIHKRQQFIVASKINLTIDQKRTAIS